MAVEEAAIRALRGATEQQPISLAELTEVVHRACESMVPRPPYTWEQDVAEVILQSTKDDGRVRACKPEGSSHTGFFYYWVAE